MDGKTLSGEDRRVIDLLLNQTRRTAGNTSQDQERDGSAFAASIPHVFSSQRLAAAEKWMRVLDTMPVEEPSPDLVQRTMRRIEQHTESRMPAAALRSIAAQRPQA